MTTLSRDDKVLLHQGPGYVGVIRNQVLGGWSVNFNPGSGDAWLVLASLTKLPDDTPILRTGTTVQVRCDAPYHPHSRGETCGAEIQNGVFGYSLVLDGTGEQVWVPVEALIRVKATAREGGE